jgi:hypothetical protein
MRVLTGSNKIRKMCDIIQPLERADRNTGSTNTSLELEKYIA